MSNNIKIMEELNNIENIFRDQTNKNIIMKKGVAEIIEEFQKPVITELKNIDTNINNAESNINKNINKKIVDVNKNELFKQVRGAFDMHTTSDWDVNLTAAIKPKFREHKKGHYNLVLGKTEFSLTQDKFNNELYFNLPGGGKILYSENLMNLIKGQPFDATNNLEDLKDYERILKKAGAKRIRDGRLRKLEEKILNLGETSQYIDDDDLSGMQLQGDPSGVKRRETRSLDGISDRTADRTTDIFLGDSSGDITGDGLYKKHKGCGVNTSYSIPVDLTNKSPIDLLIELNKLKVAKKAGNNNTLGRANILLDWLLKLHTIDKKQYKKKLKFFTS